jgi:hypothetical protein
VFFALGQGKGGGGAEWGGVLEKAKITYR